MRNSMMAGVCALLCSALLGCPVEDATSDAGEGGSGGITTAPPKPPTTDTTVTFDPCAGCKSGSECLPTTPEHCGEAGSACVTCSPGDDECTVPTCVEGVCGVEAAPDDTTCSVGLCDGGTCNPCRELVCFSAECVATDSPNGKGCGDDSVCCDGQCSASCG